MCLIFILFFPLKKKNTAVAGSNNMLPVLKINDCHLSNGQTKSSLSQAINSTNSKEPNSADSLSSNVNVQMNNTEDSDDYDDEEDEESGDEDEEEMEAADIVAMQREVLKALRIQGNVDYDL